MTPVRHRRLASRLRQPDTPQTRRRRLRPAVGPAASEPATLKDFSGARLLVSDIRVAGLLLNHARLRALERYLGVPEEQANLATMVMVLVLAESLQDHSARTVQAIRSPKRPAGGDVFLATGVVRALAQGVAGPTVSDTPGFGLLIAIAALATVARPAAQRARAGVSAQSRRARELFYGRYGHLLERSSG